MGHILQNISDSGVCTHCANLESADFITALTVLILLLLTRLFLNMKRSKKTKLSPSVQGDPER